MQRGRRTRPLLRREQVRAIDFVREEKAYPAKRQNQQRHSGRRRRRGKVPMSGLMLLMPMVIAMVAMRVVTSRR